MRSRPAFLISLVILTVLLGAWAYLDPATTDLLPSLGKPSTAGALKTGRIKGADFSKALSNNPRDLWNNLRDSKDVLFYGVLALFGIVMMGLAIGSASTSTKDKKAAAIELLRQEKEKAENLAKLKAEFLNQVSHELRTPLAVIIGYLECITDGLYGQVEAKHQEILQVVAKQSSHLKNMIDQILIYSRLEANKQPLRIEEFHVNKIISDLRETFEFLCRQKELELYWELSKNVTTVRTDAERLKEALSNLLQNAIKYTDRGSIHVRVREQSATHSIVLEVADTGMGIPEHYLATIFEPFTQVHKTSSENSRGGIGLGLSIVKKDLEQIKGTISVESELGKGTTFRITIPRIYRENDARHRKLLTLFGLLRRSEGPPAIGANGTAKTHPAGRITDAPPLN
jgi:signal transduction histidine kinase